jgi:hypothetical protein
MIMRKKKKTTRPKKKKATMEKMKMMKMMRTTLLWATMKEKMYRKADEIKTARNEALNPTVRLKDLLNRIDITTLLEFRIKRVLHLGREEYKAIVEIFNAPSVISQHKGPAFKATYRDAVADAAW